MNELIERSGGLVSFVVLVAMCLNIALSALSSILEKVKGLTESKLDDKAAEIVMTIINILQKLIDFASANRQHK